MNQHLCISIDPLIKLLVSRRSIINVDVVRNHEAGLGFSRNDQVPEVPVIFLDVALAGPE